MFSIDQAALPNIPTRKALLVIDFQNDFLESDGALLVSEPSDVVRQTLKLAQNFGKSDAVVWVCTEFEKFRHVGSEQVITSEDEAQLSSSRRGSNRRAKALDTMTPPTSASDPEMFLSPGGTPCVRSAPGNQIPARVKQEFGKRDIVFVKSHYSAFKSGQLLQLLRGKLVTQLFICGSLANIGVYATAIDAAMYGYEITIVEDCCGYRSTDRFERAIQGATVVTGCEVTKADIVIEKLCPKTISNVLTESPSLKKAYQGHVDTQASRATTSHRRVGPRSSKTELHEKLAALDLSAETSDRIQDDWPTEQPLEVDPDAQPLARTLCEPSVEATCADTSTEKTLQTDHQKGPSDTILPGIRNQEDAAETQAQECKAITAPPQDAEAGAIRGTRAPLGEPRSVVEVDPGLETLDGSPGTLCEGDTSIIRDVLPQSLAEDIFTKLKNEVKWKTMSHQGGEVPRLVAVQGEVTADGIMPIYRHPADESPPLLPFSDAVLKIKSEIEKQVGHPLNHVLIQLYRGGKDFISEHSDKTLDIVPESYIANVSLGAERTMVFRTKKPTHDKAADAPSASETKRRVQRAQLPHNSLCRMGLKTNQRWLHTIKQDKRAERDKSPAELAFSGERISLTFRRIGTFLNCKETHIWGQGATCKTQEGARPIQNGQTAEAVRMLKAFGAENHSSSFDRNQHYGEGFDVLHIRSSPRFLYSQDKVINLRIRLMLAEYKISYAKGSLASSVNHMAGGGGQNPSGASGLFDKLPVRFIDDDEAKTVVEGDVAIMLYLEAVHGPGQANRDPRTRSEAAQVFTRFQQGLTLLDKWRACRAESDEEPRRLSKQISRELVSWNNHSSDDKYMAGPVITLADFAVWPVLHDIVRDLGVDALGADEECSLRKYYSEVLEHALKGEVLDT